MKALFTFFNPSGGMETLNRARCRILTARGVECHLLYTHWGEGRKNITNIPVHMIRTDEEIKALLDREQFDLIVVCTDIDLAVRIRRLGYAGLLIFELQGLGVLEEAKAIIADFSGRICTHTNALLYPVTAHLKMLLREQCPGLPHFCFDNPVDPLNFEYTAYPPREYPVLGWVGRIQKNKNWREFLLIGESLLKVRPELYLWIFHDDTLSDPDEQAEFDQLVTNAGLTSRLILYSNIPHHQMADYMSIIGDSGGLLCSTSILEGFGYSVAEAMLCRCPVLSTDSDGIRRLLLNGKTGRIYRRGHVEEAVSEALSLMYNHNFRNFIRKAAEQHVRKKFAPEQYANRFMSMYYHLAKK